MAKKAAKKKVLAAKKKAGRGKRPVVRKPAAFVPSGDLQHRLNTLLHTMRCIAQHEDELCTLLHAACRTGRISGPLLRELQAVLQDLPGEEYLHDLYAVQQVVPDA